ncbi:sugar kinase [Nakamurella leprariae]|uniref:Sugar kinase n=1 Tax=Nakamurella leprariae TaxID=2803911 RepID=A0A938Y9L2_9ACTN|nr:sugar kinase [Nakamurella leprariae]MBM9468571.1 sugar kinase [Nakamurella leprariae]
MTPPAPASPKVVTFGETMALVDATTIGPFFRGAQTVLSHGGAESNLAIALARLNVPVAWIGCLGEDSLGDLVAREITAEGVQAHIRRVPDAPTGLMLKEPRTVQHTKVWYYRKGSAGSQLAETDLDPHLIVGADVLHVTGITPALSESAAAAVTAACTFARRAGTLVSLDVNYRSRLWSRDEAGTALRALMPLVDIVFAGLDEAALLLGAELPPTVAVRALADLGPSEVLLKRGSRGGIAFENGTSLSVPARPVRVLDPVGAGDAFAAGYLYERLRGTDLAGRLSTAVISGAFACLGRGDWESMPREHELSLLESVEDVMR